MESNALILLLTKFAPESDNISGRKVIAAVIAKIKPKSIRNAKALFLKEAREVSLLSLPHQLPLPNLYIMNNANCAFSCSTELVLPAGSLLQ